MKSSEIASIRSVSDSGASDLDGMTRITVVSGALLGSYKKGSCHVANAPGGRVWAEPILTNYTT